MSVRSVENVLLRSPEKLILGILPNLEKSRLAVALISVAEVLFSGRPSVSAYTRVSVWACIAYC